MSDLVTFGELLRRLRKTHDLSQEALAQKAACALDTIKKFEGGRRRPSRQMAGTLADAFALSGAERDQFIAAARTGGGADAAVLAPLDGDDAALIDAPVALPSRRLPRPATPFIGRTSELAEVLHLLDQSDTQLLTLVAPGGMGKTRLALAAAEHLLDTKAFADGVAFAELAPLVSATHLDTALAAALGLPLDNSGRRSPRTQLIDYLREKELLLVLDNCEHLRDATADLAALIVREAPGITLLATSRERLGLRLERPLPIDGMRNEADGIALFTSTALIARPDFSLDDETIDLVKTICARVGGMPLAIELAAGWIDTLSPAEIAVELDRSDELLSTRAHDMPERHRSVRAVCDATWGRLTTSEQTVFAQVAVFHGGATRRALQAITGASLIALQSLVGRALLRYDAENERYSIHELLRQYAAEQLAGDPDAERKTYQRHADYYLQSLAALDHVLKGPGQVQALEEIGNDRENAHAAWDWAVRAGHTKQLTAALAAWGLFCEWEGHYTEGLRAFSPPNSFLIAQPAAVHLGFLAWQSAFARLLGEHERAQQIIDTALALIGSESSVTDSATHGFVLLQQARLALRNNYPAAEKAYLHCLEIARRCGDRWLIATALADFGHIRLDRGDVLDAETAWRESLALSRELGGPLGIANVLAALSTAARRQGRIGENVRLAQESCDLFVSLGNRLMSAYGIQHLARALLWARPTDQPRAVTLLTMAAESFRELGDPAGLAETLCYRGGALSTLGRYPEAEQDLRTCLLHAEQVDDQAMMGYCRYFLACIALARGAHQEAEREVFTAIALLERMQQMDWIGRAYIAAADVERVRNRPDRAWERINAGLRLGLKHRSYISIIFALRSAALLLADDGESLLALELGNTARSLMYGRWAEDVYYTRLDALATALSPQRVAAALERGATRDPWEAAANVLDTIEADQQHRRC